METININQGAVIWREIIGYEGLYQVSSDGRVKSINRQVKSPRGNRTVNEKILKQYLDKDGYYHLFLNQLGKSNNFFVHRLVAMAFIPNSTEKPQVNHVNGLKTDNRVENLEWVSPSENIQHAVHKGLAAIGVRHGNTKFKESDIICIRGLLSEGIPVNKIANYFKVNQTTISRIRDKKTWKHLSCNDNMLESLRSVAEKVLGAEI